ncbi:SPFH domain / Band 7 family protein [Posidoniimonas polymericola]|uniref:SPFH domain / Band 7 family protein n=1 Tax=Posidoniimonas polymericola TaxID=2528002 RepID=A0A5C5YIE0_9BACT|nr:SPFH domain-containing protein [Posidoniimonas polymericola]TWT74633.1 SPFH domain / Band 7 family protein [Posidoniimonas polymericola]
MSIRSIAAVAFLLIVGLGSYAWVEWTINRVYVDEGQSLMLRYKGPLVFGSRENAVPGHWAEEGQIGVLAKLRGPGRHFYCPVWWERTLVDDVVVLPGEVGVVTCKLGDDLPGGEFLVDGDIGETQFKGILRKVLHPGRYRINPYGYEVETVRLQTFTSGNTEKKSGWVEIPTGYVGVVTNLAANNLTGAKAGISEDVLPPGIYLINGREQNIDIVEVGYRHNTIQVAIKRDREGNEVFDENGEPIIADGDSGIQFPSSDGFSMHLDFTAIWGLMPEQAPHAIRTIGNVESIEEKIVLPQIDSILRNRGSEYKAVELLVGDDREKYQQESLEEFHKVLDAKQISLLYGLVRHVYIPEQVRKPIQMSFIADELTLTREQEQLTAKEEAKLREAEEQVTLASRTVEVGTKKMVAGRHAEGDREAETIRAETIRKVAAIEKETAALEAEAERVRGEAENGGKKLVEQATADRFRLAVQAFGTPAAYNNWVFASSLPDDVRLQLMYAGPGTLWTDMAKGEGGFGVRANFPLENPAPKTPPAKR